MHSLFLPLYYKINTYNKHLWYLSCKTYFRFIVCMKGISRSVPCYLNLAHISYLELKLAESVAGKKLNSSFFLNMPLFLLFLFIGIVLFLKSCNNFAKCKVSQLDDISGWYIYAVWTYSGLQVNISSTLLKSLLNQWITGPIYRYL